jgi:hypothetical protein
MTTELDSLALQAAALDGQVESQTPDAQVAAQQQAEVMTLADTNTEGVCMIIDIALPVVGEMYPSLTAVYTPEACGRIAGALGPVLAKYGIDLGELRGRWGEEILAALVCWPIAKATYAAIKHDIAVANGKEPVAVPAAAPAPPAAKVGLVPGDFGYVEPE